MTSEALQNPYFVRLYCKNIDKTHSLTEPNDKIQFHGNYFFKKKGGGDHFGKGGGGTDPLPPPPKSALDAYQIDRLPMAERVGCGTSCLLWSLGVREVVGSRPGRGNSKESFSSNQETGKVFSPEMPFYSKF